eukprot:g2939.t1
MREVMGFMTWAALMFLFIGNALALWVVFWRYVVRGDGPLARHTTVIVWVAWFWGAMCWRQWVYRNCGLLIRRIFDHLEMFVMASVCTGIAVNCAFFIHTPGPRLYDVGFALVPEQAKDSAWRPLSDILTVNLPFVMVVVSFTWTRLERSQMFVDWMRMMTIAYTLRGFCTPFTSLPGPAPHCQPAFDQYSAPYDYVDMLTWLGPLVGNFFTCGDLLFSGHAAYVTTTLLVFMTRINHRYPPRTAAAGIARWVGVAVYFTTVAILAIAGRKHYTVDMILGLIIAALSFGNFQHSWVRDTEPVWAWDQDAARHMDAPWLHSRTTGNHSDNKSGDAVTAAGGAGGTGVCVEAEDVLSDMGSEGSRSPLLGDSSGASARTVTVAATKEVELDNRV